ncbi:Amuc_1098 family type IV pilus outer membrane protein [Roseimicrobium sp. ORNL1]|uniref:Amuc_1098 family type IV pilus outer membrane protein n=1 Tax=Roseimicrobium sp. ORNL1 TaxID=2711231 RepID=UPI0013E1C3EB|nr:Amuc_1098 family type IV pilus outer membrane protein [Roseimicrobium sp. ORNL1]QIF05683.1 tetratricopeptide repeat protein [Roseimicrobium sp. ORNL1]
MYTPASHDTTSPGTEPFPFATVSKKRSLFHYTAPWCAVTALSCAAALAGPPSTGNASAVAQREIARRMQRVADARAAIAEGDKLMEAKDCDRALQQYLTAIELLPMAPVSAQERAEANAKYAEAAVCLAAERAKNGHYGEARTLLNDALKRQPDFKKAEVLLKQLDDPERYEVALTPGHVENVHEVQKALEKGYSYYNLGDFDKANKTFQEALRIDPYNKAARRGMEQVEQQRADYFDVARDHTRVKMLNAVNQAWEDPVPISLQNNVASAYGQTISAGAYYTDKMSRIIFPTVQFAGASIEEAVEFLRIKSKDYDTIERDPAKRGVNLIIKPGTAPSTATISLDLKDVPMSEALRYITELGGMKYKVEPYAVVVVPLSEVGNEMYTRTFKVPPDFLTSAAADGAGAGPAAPADPFAPASGTATSSLKTKANAKDILVQNGIPFPDGSSAAFISATSQLIVRNTQPSLDLVEQYVEELTRKVPQQVYITAKFVEVSQKNTDELGFDWTMGAFNIGGQRVFGSGGTTGNSANGSVSGTDFPFSLDGSVVGSNPITSGNRSGSTAISTDSIDGLLNAQNLASSLAPGVFAVSGVYTDPQFQMVIRALSQKKGVDLMSAPSVTTRSGQRATVEVIREFIYPTEFDPPQIPQSVGATTGSTVGTSSSSTFPVTPTTPTAFEMRPVGVRMEVDPVIGPDGYTIDLNLAPEVTEFEGFINYGSPINTSSTDALGNPTTVTLTENRIEQPIFSTRKVTTAVTVWDGQTVAMGGLIREDVQQVDDKVPILGDIPILGRLFQSKAEDHYKRNLMVFVTASLIDPSGEKIRKPAPALEPADSLPTVETTLLPPVSPSQPVLPLNP